MVSGGALDETTMAAELDRVDGSGECGVFGTGSRGRRTAGAYRSDAALVACLS